ncbi:penicillin-binding protein 2 [Flavobacterium lindanitolerans]|uniref:Penicillin-binding protein 2 n=3 Tax=Flavobacterium lindanitolerans TaxID=428988 RepID=A0A497VAP0_9FLAO|nr:penicillin-binding protein 2 [Flavobacterium lindanitolerans]MDQ7960167.1 penicillin-binding protein 2 [Flavobacterium lindanitolerans]PKW28501.1 penicillin-binding protein 2 [Flavobacterium lindanitolerans]RLJ35994.1 penicillin-binding protein 2 [Flavobacterium lindanitolerans]
MRKLLLPSLIIVAAIVIVARLFYLQIIDDSFIKKSDNNAIKIKYDYPERGYMFDRNGVLLVANQPSYDVMVIPKDVKEIDTLEFCKLLKITKEEFITKMNKATVYSPRLPSVFLPQLNKKEYAGFQEKIRKYQGFYIQKRSLRDYQVNAAANVFGYIAQVNDAIIKKNPYYKSGDLIGKQGVEEVYEEFLRGTKGVKYIQKDRFNRDIGSYKEGIYDTIAVQGEDVTLTLDIELQKYGESLMINKRGGIVALEPKSGEILALVSAPSYDPAILVGRDRSKNYLKLSQDSLAKPLFDRGLLAEYPPGSPFKIMTGLIGLQEEVIDENMTFHCSHGFSYGRGAFMKCHDSGNNNLHTGIAHSCNTYFANVFMRTINKYPKPTYGVDAWSNHLKSFGLGNFMGYDLPAGRKGLIPDSRYYKRWYPNGGWRSTTIVSNAIGQGEVSTTPIQLANMMAAVANEGYYYTPHIIKKIKNHTIDKKYTTKHVTTVDKQYFKPVIEGLFAVYNEGTARSLRVEGIDICGKTGTAENKTKINGVTTQLTDHSIFVAFAPKDNPKIAVAVFVENGYWGARWAGPIASLMLEKYLRGKITRTDLEKRMLEGSLESEYAKVTSGKPFKINQ